MSWYGMAVLKSGVILKLYIALANFSQTLSKNFCDSLFLFMSIHL